MDRNNFNEEEKNRTEHMEHPENTQDENNMPQEAETDENEPGTEPEEGRNDRKSGSGMKAGIAGGLIGGIITAAIVAMLFIFNVIPTGTDSAGDDNGSSTEDGPNIVENLSTSSEDANLASSIDEVAEAVVGVVNLQQQSVWTETQEAGTGSGIIYKKEDGSAYVVTNQHVVAGAQEVEVVMNEDERVPAQVLGEDPLTDLAVLQIDGETVDTVAQFKQSGELQVGETALAIGNPLGLQFANSVTKGIISGLERSVPVDTNSDGQSDWVTEVIQTDAAINPGNSGGALVNADGEVIGINSMKIAQGAVEGIGFAIPVDSALPVMEQLETDGEVVRPQIGISTASLNQVPGQVRAEINLPEDIEGGMIIAQVQDGSPAAAAGLQQYDVITKINGQQITSILELRQYLYTEASVGETVEISYIRDGEQQTTELQLEETPQEEEEEAQPA